MTLCDFYPVLPPSADLSRVLAELPALLAETRISALRLPVESRTPDAEYDELVRLLRAHDTAFIVAPSRLSCLDALPRGSFDGVHIDEPTQFGPLRGIYGAALQLGCLCETVDQAMEAGENGADYIAFTADRADLIRRWSHMAELPVIAEAVESASQARLACEAGADFLSVPLRLDGRDAALIREIRSSLQDGRAESVK